MKKVGVTGGIGAGKSTVCEIFKVLGIPVYNADQRAKHLMANDPELKENIIAVFGEESYINDQINRDHLAKVVFNHTDQISKLNLLVHPAVGKDFEKWVAEQDSQYVIKEAALLIETESYKELDVLVNVMTDEETRINRVLSRDSFRTKEELAQILKKQTTDELRTKLSDHLIQNGENDLLIPQVLNLHQILSN